MIRTSRARLKAVGATTSFLLSVALLTACSSDDGGSGDPQESSNADGVGALGAEEGPCPSVLPSTESPSDGLGTQEPAAAAPSLPAPDSATVCMYNFTEDASGDDQSASYTFTLSGEPVPVKSRNLEALTEELTKLAPVEPDAKCPAKLGRRWLLVTTADEEVTGVVVDDFGCVDVRLTDAPLETAPGEATREGTVSGVLGGSYDLLNQIKLVWVTA